MSLSSVLVVEVNSLFADQIMTEQSLRLYATLKYCHHIEFINLNPSLSQMSSFHVQKPCPLQSERPTSQGYWTFLQSKRHSMFKRDLKETSFIYLLSRTLLHSEIIWGRYRRIVIFSLVRNNSNFPVFKATEQITKYTQSCLEIMRKYAPKWRKNNDFWASSITIFPGEHAPGSMGPTSPSYTPFRRVKFYPLGVTPVTTTATAVQNSIENPDMYMK